MLAPTCLFHRVPAHRLPTNRLPTRRASRPGALPSLGAGALLIALAAAASAPAAAATFSNGAVSTSNPWNVTSDVVADDFVMTSAGVLTGATVYLSDSYGMDNWVADGSPLTYFLFADDGGAPLSAGMVSGEAQNISLSDSGVSHHFGEVQAVSFTFETGFAAAANVTYWLGIHAADSYAASGTVLWMNAAGLNGAASHVSSGSNVSTGAWSSLAVDRAMSVTTDAAAAVPLPAAAPMLAAAAAALGFAGRRRRARKGSDRREA